MPTLFFTLSLILSIESSGNICSVALQNTDKLIAVKQSNEANIHARLLAVFVKQILEENNKQISDLSAIAVSGGPGSYTGLRIGVSLAKGICFAANLPLISVNTLQSIALSTKENLNNLTDNSLFMPMIDARRMEVYTQSFDINLNSISHTKPLIIDDCFFKNLDSTKQYFASGNGTLKIDKSTAPAFFKIIDNIEFSSVNVAVLAYKKYLLNDFENLQDYEPVYLKEFAEIIKR